MNNRGGISHPPGKFHMRGSKTYTPRNSNNNNFSSSSSSQQQQQQGQASSNFEGQQQQQSQSQSQSQSNNGFQSKFNGKGRGGYNNNNNSNSNSNNNTTSPNLNSTSGNNNSNFRGGHRGGSRGGNSDRGGLRGGSSRGGGRGGYRGGQSSFYQKSGPRLLTSIVALPPFSGGAIIGVRGSLWGLLNKATTARLKVFKNTAIIKCADAQQLDRAKEIVLKLKNTSPKYLSLIDYKGEQKIKFVHQPSFSEVVLESGAVDPTDVPAMQEIINHHESQYVSRLNETFSTLYSDKNTSTPFIDIEAGKIWYLHSSNIPSTPMTSDKYELYTESLASVFQPSNVINETFITSNTTSNKLFKQKKTKTYISVLDTESLDLLCIKCNEEKVTSSSTTTTTNNDSSNNLEYKFTQPYIYKLTHINSSKVLFPQIKSGSDLRVTIDTHSKSKLEPQQQYDNLLKFIDSIKIHKNSSGSNTYQIPDSNLFMTESIITRKVSIYRTTASGENSLQFHIVEDIATRYTTSNPEVNKPSTTVLCTSPTLYDLFKSKNWTADQASDELKKLSKNLRLLVSKHLDSSKFQPPLGDNNNNNFEQDIEDEDEDEN